MAQASYNAIAEAADVRLAYWGANTKCDSNPNCFWVQVQAEIGYRYCL